MGSHEFLEHVGESRLRLRGASLEDLLVEAGLAFGQLEQGGIPAASGQLTREITVAASDPEGLLVDWLNELIYLSETEACAPSSVEVRMTGPAAFEATVTSQRLSRSPALVKAATHHGLRLERVPGGWEAEVVLDV